MEIQGNRIFEYVLYTQLFIRFVHSYAELFWNFLRNGLPNGTFSNNIVTISTYRCNYLTTFTMIFLNFPPVYFEILILSITEKTFIAKVYTGELLLTIKNRLPMQLNFDAE